jgi:hydrogenase maturation protein HypF
MREPWRNTVAHFNAAFGPDYLQAIDGTVLAASLSQKPLQVIDRMIAARLNAPLSSSAGRLFDAVAAAIGVCRCRQDYEGQAAMEMEALARPHLGKEPPYPIGITDHSSLVLSWAPLWQAIVADLKAGVGPARIAARFHAGLADTLARAACALAAANGVRRIVLSGGVMQNRILVADLHKRLVAQSFVVPTHRLVPANDGGLALGQSVIAALS